MNKVKITLLILMVVATINYAQVLNVKGNVSTSTEAVKNALITFIETNNTTKSYTTTTDSLGNYSIGLVTDIEDDVPVIPKKFELAQNYPNPFSNETVITYKLNEQANVKVTIYDILGREVKKYTVGQQNVGIHGILWDGKNNFGEEVTTGIYFYKLQTGKESLVNKMVFNRSRNSGTTLGVSNYLFSERTIGKETAKAVVSTDYKVIVRSDTNTTPLIVIQEFPNQQIDSDTTLDYEVEKASILLGKSIDDVKLGDDSQTVINKLGDPDEIQYGDFAGFLYEYLNQDKTERRLMIVFSESSKVTSITVYKVYDGKTKDGIGIGVHRDSVSNLLGAPSSTYSGESIVDHYLLDPLPGYLNSQIYLYYKVENNKLIGLLMMTRD